MKTTKRVTLQLLSLALALCVITCSKDNEPGDDGSDPDGNPDPETMAETIAELIANGNDFEEFPTSRESDTTNVSEPVNEDFDATDGSEDQNRWICTTKTVNVLDGNGQFPLFNTNASVIWPGNLLQGKSLSRATPTDIPVKRLGGKITYNLITGNPVATRDVDIIDQGAVAQAMNDIIAQNGDVLPANFDLKVESINSKEQLALEMGLDVSSFTTKVSSSFSLNTASEYSSVLVKLTQGYYTMSYVTPTSVDEFFDPSVTVDELDDFVQSDNPATFISSVTYGRIFYMLYESTASSQEMEIALDAAYDGLTTVVEGRVDLDFLREYKNLSIKVIAYGGDAQGTFETVGAVLNGEEGVNNLQELLNRLGESTDIRAGLPISYVVKSVENRSQTVGTKISTEYDVVDCEYKGILPPEGYRSLVDLYKGDEDGGGIGAMIQIAESNILIFNKMGTKYAWYNGGTGTIKGIFGITDEASPLGVVELNDVGSATRFNDTRIYFFDKTGLSGSRFTYDATDPALDTSGDAPVSPIGNFEDTIDQPFQVNVGFGDESNFPFVGRGFEAATKVGRITIAFFGRPGNEYALYTTDGDWADVLESSTWFNEEDNQVGSPSLFDKVGGVGRIRFSASTERWLMVNEDGSEIMEYQGSPTTTRKFEGPWVIN